MSIPLELLAEVNQFMRSRIILSAAELDLFTELQAAPAAADELAGRLGLDGRATRRVLDCLVGFGLLEKSAGPYRVTERGALLSDAHPESLRPMVLHYNQLWKTWSHLTETVQQGTSPARATAGEKDDDSLAAFIGGMHVIGRTMAAEVAAALDLSGYRRLLDVGGASGSYTIAFLRRNPDLTAVLFDLPRVIPIAEKRLRQEGFLDRVNLAAGDFERDELPAGCDLALLSAIIHQNSPAANQALYRKIHRVLAPGGALLIRDHVMDPSRTWPAAGAVFAINMLVGTSGGDTYTFDEIRHDLALAGFEDIQSVLSGERMDSVLQARKPQ